MAVLHRPVGGATWERLVTVVLLRAGSLGRSVVVDLVELIRTVDDAVLDSRLVLRMDRMWLVSAHASVGASPGPPTLAVQASSTPGTAGVHL